MVKVSPKISLMETISRNKGRKYLSKLLQSQKSGSNVKYNHKTYSTQKIPKIRYVFYFHKNSIKFFSLYPQQKKKKKKLIKTEKVPRPPSETVIAQS